jgi:release factor glutamine methyltransferase
MSEKTPHSVKDTLQAATTRLQVALKLERQEARLEAQILTARALETNRAWLVAHDQDALSPVHASAVEALIARREQGEPVAYILGEKEFYGRMFKVTPDVLIPRPETELLVEAALELLPKDQPAHVLDLGTGSGCIALTIALARPLAKVIGVDKSSAALQIAQRNASALRTQNTEFKLSDWYAALDEQRFDVIVSNPPYICDSHPCLLEGVGQHEPLCAFSAGKGGLADLREIIGSAMPKLMPNGWLLLEHGFDQGEICLDLLHHAGFRNLRSHQDLQAHTRISFAQH